MSLYFQNKMHAKVQFLSHLLSSKIKDFVDVSWIQVTAFSFSFDLNVFVFEVFCDGGLNAFKIICIHFFPPIYSFTSSYVACQKWACQCLAASQWWRKSPQRPIKSFIHAPKRAEFEPFWGASRLPATHHEWSLPFWEWTGLLWRILLY